MRCSKLVLFCFFFLLTVRFAGAETSDAGAKESQSKAVAKKVVEKKPVPEKKKEVAKKTSTSSNVAKAAKTKKTAETAKKKQKSMDDIIQDKFAKDAKDKIFAKGLLQAFLFLFFAGFLVSLTPCVYPMIPITIAVIGGKTSDGEGSRLKSFLLALTYVLGMAIPYSLLGLVVAFTGKQLIVLGGIFNNKYFLGFLILLFSIMGASMWGAFDMALPASLQNKLAGAQGKSKGKGFLGIFVLGMIGAVLATPCSGPVVVGLLAYIAKEGNAFFGFLYCFVFSLGIGVPFLVLGAGVVSALPRSGVWMTEVKKILGLTLFGAAFYYGQFLLVANKGLYQVLLGCFLIVTAVFAGAFTSFDKTAWWFDRLKKAFGILSITVGMYLFVGTMLLEGFFLPPLKKWFPKPVVQSVAPAKTTGQQSKHPECLPPASHPANKPFWFTDEKKGVACAKKMNRPYIIDFWAEWCAACKKLEKLSFNHASAVDESKRFVMIKIEYSEENAEGKRLQKKYGIKGLPWVRFVSKDGKVLLKPLIVGFLDHKKLVHLMKKVK